MENMKGIILMLVIFSMGNLDRQVGCNWKVFVDNYLDGGYHVQHLHKDLAAALSIGDIFLTPAMQMSDVPYRVTLVVEYLGYFVDLDLGSSPGCWAATVAIYCPSRMVER